MSAWFVFSVTICQGWCQDRLLFGQTRPVIVIDPGHGGRETGAVGPAGATEKSVVLELSRAVSSLLAESCNVILTRNSDYDVPLYERTAIANEHRAAVFLSLHAAASPGLTSDGMYCYVDRPDPEAENQEREIISGKGAVRWDQTQDRHRESSRSLADQLVRRIRQYLPSASIQQKDAPLPVLKGANMPAVLLEVGTLTQPTGEAALTDEDHRRHLAEAIAEGLNDFLSGGNSRP